MSFELDFLEDWNLVSEKGLPEDFTICLVIWKSSDGKLELFAGSYDEEFHQFKTYVGRGGLVLDEKSAIAWIDQENIEVKSHIKPNEINCKSF